MTQNPAMPIGEVIRALQVLQAWGAQHVCMSTDITPATAPAGEFAKTHPLAASRVVLGRKGRATTREIHDAIVAGDVMTTAKNLINSLGVSLSKANDIVKDDDGKWRLKTPEEM